MIVHVFQNPTLPSRTNQTAGYHKHKHNNFITMNTLSFSLCPQWPPHFLSNMFISLPLTLL